ncbi:Serine/threonine-protein kinase CTR1 [Hordeum vulgare]|nr:Serine/threonine-protein kinase CTR1 [Hordeum vulgare]KAE8781918.1 Serine/threonine-protein kinase CTR1 [Hordeum vulgare]
MDWVEQFNICDLKGPKNLPTSGPLSFTSRQFPRDYYNVKSMKIKLICNFGGTFLPRPSDGELRYIGGDRHLMKINRDISWQELISKTTKLIGRAHTVKYHLPGEQLSMLISITSDDDLRHMIDECIVLEENREMINMYLFSRKDDERHVHFVVQGSSDAEKEAQFIALVNGVIPPGYEPRAHSVGKSSVNDLDQLLFGISVEAGPPAGRTQEAAVSIKSKPLQSIAVPPVATSGQLERTPLSSQIDREKTPMLDPAYRLRVRLLPPASLSSRRSSASWAASLRQWIHAASVGSEGRRRACLTLAAVTLRRRSSSERRARSARASPAPPRR